MPTWGFQSCVSDVLHFGLGSVSKIDSIVLTWPSGHRQVERQVPLNQRIKISENEQQASQTTPPTIHPYFTPYDSGIKFVHKDYDYNDFKRQPLLPFMLSHVGPVLAKRDVNGDKLTDVFIGASKGQ